MKKLSSLLFGTAGIPIAARGQGTEAGIQAVRELDLDAMELEFVHSVHVSAEKAPIIKKTKQEHDIELTCHASYYVNLNAQEKEKKEASKKRIFSSARRAWECGARSVCFHPGFYLKEDPGKVYTTIKNELKAVIKAIQDAGIGLWVRPETTGKPTQFGSFKELIMLSAEVEQVMPCIDFSHLHARTNGAYNTMDEFKEVLDLVEEQLGQEALHDMHIHLSGIAYGEKGEKHHLILKDSDMAYKELLHVLHEYKVKGVMIAESPNIESDAALLKKTYLALQ